LKKRVTLDDIAAACDASPATVSLALRNRPGVSRQRRAEILAVANKLGYVAQQRDARPDGEPMRNVALVFRTPAWTAERSAPALNHFYSWVLTGIQDGATRQHLNLNLGTIPVNVDNEATTLPRMLASQPLDGVLLVGAFHEETVRAVIAEVGGDRTPMVLVDNEAPGLRVDSVTSDHRGGMAEATRHLIARGHRAIGFAGSSPGVDANFDLRRAGYEDAMRDAGLPVHDLPVGSDDDDDLVAALSVRRGELTALACANDYTATLVVHAARRASIDVPGELSLIGFDDTMDARQSHPQLSTMAVDKAGLGRLAVTILDYRLDWPDAAPMRMSLVTRLVQRDSVVQRAAASDTAREPSTAT
jgi:LacI family transcriptional regulator